MYAMENVYSFRRAAKLFKISPSRLYYWAQTGLVPATASTRRGEDAFSFRDLVCIKAVCMLLEAGIPVRRIRRGLASLRERVPELARPLESLEVWIDGSDRIIVRLGDSIYEPSGQQVIDFALPAPREDDVPSLLGEDSNAGLDWYEQGFQLDGNGVTQNEAIAAYRRCLELLPDFVDAHCNLGAIYHQRGELREARLCYEQALARDPDHFESRFNLGCLMDEEGAFEQALWQFEKALRLGPALPELHRSLGLLYEKLGRKERARGHWRKLLELAPDDPLAEMARTRIEE
jgi:DNA-binding transcriptional MerR regulator